MKKIKGGFVDLPVGLSSLMYPGAAGSLYVFFLAMISKNPELVKKLKGAASGIGSNNMMNVLEQSNQFKVELKALIGSKCGKMVKSINDSLISDIGKEKFANIEEKGKILIHILLLN